MKDPDDRYSRTAAVPVGAEIKQTVRKLGWDDGNDDWACGAALFWYFGLKIAPAEPWKTSGAPPWSRFPVNNAI